MAQQPLTTVVDLLARIPAFESAAGRGLLVAPEFSSVKRFDNDRQADLLSIARGADAAGAINEMLLVASALAGETQLGADLKNVRIGLKQARVDSVLNGSVQRIHWPWQPYRLAAEPGWRATLTFRGRSRVSEGGPPSTEIEVPPKELFGVAGSWRARCEVVLERLTGDGNDAARINYTVLLVPSWHGTAAKIGSSLAAIWTCFVAYVFGRQSRIEETGSAGLALGLLITCAVLVVSITGWRPRTEALRSAARAPAAACLAWIVALSFPFVAGARFYLAQNPGPACETVQKQYWDEGAWMLVPKQAALTCRPTAFEIDETKPGCSRRELRAVEPPVQAPWDRRLLAVFGAEVAKADASAKSSEELKQQCEKRPPLPPVAKTKVYNCTARPLLVGAAARRLAPEEGDEATPDELSFVRFEGGQPTGAFPPSRTAIWQLSRKGESWFQFTEDKVTPTLTAPRDRATFDVHVNCQPSKLTVRDDPNAGGRLELDQPNGLTVQTLEHCRVAPGLMSNGDRLNVNVGTYVVENAALVEQQGLWIVGLPQQPLTWKQSICVVRGADGCRLEPRPRGTAPEGRTEGPLQPCPRN